MFSIHAEKPKETEAGKGQKGHDCHINVRVTATWFETRKTTFRTAAHS